MSNEEKGNGQAIAMELLGLLVYVQTLENGDKYMLRRVQLNPKQARSVLNFIKHRCHGGRLMLAEKGTQLPPPVPNREVVVEQKLIVTPPE